MKRFCFVCPRCGTKSVRGELPWGEQQLLCGPCMGPQLDGPQIQLKRDYKAESVAVGKVKP